MDMTEEERRRQRAQRKMYKKQHAAGTTAWPVIQMLFRVALLLLSASVFLLSLSISPPLSSWLSFIVVSHRTCAEYGEDVSEEMMLQRKLFGDHLELDMLEDMLPEGDLMQEDEDDLTSVCTRVLTVSFNLLAAFCYSFCFCRLFDLDLFDLDLIAACSASSRRRQSNPQSVQSACSARRTLIWSAQVSTLPPSHLLSSSFNSFALFSLYCSCAMSPRVQISLSVCSAASAASRAMTTPRITRKPHGSSSMCLTPRGSQHGLLSSILTKASFSSFLSLFCCILEISLFRVFVCECHVFEASFVPVFARGSACPLSHVFCRTDPVLKMTHLRSFRYGSSTPRDSDKVAQLVYYGFFLSFSMTYDALYVLLLFFLCYLYLYACLVVRSSTRRCFLLSSSSTMTTYPRAWTRYCAHVVVNFGCPTLMCYF